MSTNNYTVPIFLAILLVIGVTSIVTIYAFNTNDESTATDNTITSSEKESVLSMTNEATPNNVWHSTEPSATATPTSQPVDTSNTTNSQPKQLSITFIDLPQQVQSNESFTVQWKVDGPSGIKGEDTQLEVSYQTKTSNNNSSASSSSESSQSFGSFVTPQLFDSKFSFGSAPGTINLKITARISGQIISASETIQLVN